mgnify:FL=1
MPNNMKKAGIKYGHGGGAKPYKYKGQNVPGMYQTGGGPEIGLPPKKRNLFGRIGAGIGNIFRNDANDRSIKYQGYKNNQVGSGPINKDSPRPSSYNTGAHYTSTFGKKPGRAGYRKGGSVGPNGTL